MLPELITESTAKTATSLVQAPDLRRRRLSLGLALAVLIACFIKPLGELIAFAWNSDLYSHILLIPFISLYLVWLEKRNLSFESGPAAWLALFPATAGLASLVVYWTVLAPTVRLAVDDYLALMIFSFLSLVASLVFLFLGRTTLRRIAFPLAFLVFMIPFPAALVSRIEHELQYGSAEVANWLFQFAGTPVLKQDTFFQLPGFSLQVAPECSGIHSSLILFISSLLAGYVLLRTGWRRTALALVVIPLSLLRNGFRIFVIGELCVHVNPDMINSFVHTKGGPIFFALSLVPFFLLLILLKRFENKAQANPNPTQVSSDL